MPENELSKQVKIKVVDWKKDKGDLKNIRRRVFIEEQKVPEELEWDEFDDSSMHFLATLDEKAMAVARLKADGQIGRMAVLPEYRDQGIGSLLLQFVLQQAVQKKLKHVYLHAQTTAIPFYKKHGFSTCSEIFYEAAIPHRVMLKKSAK